MAFGDGYAQQLDALHGANQHRCLIHPEQIQGRVDFTSNDYLGLRSHPALRQAALEALDAGMAMGSGGSRLLRGNHPEHVALEEYAASYFGHERMLFVANGYLANLGLFATLPQRGDWIVFDETIHASTRDGIQASVARHRAVGHNDINAFRDMLQEIRHRSTGQIWIAVESVYSMDGDVAPLPALLSLADEYDAVLIVDEAHATGLFGPTGKGLSEGLPKNRLITVHTCGKALGVAGGLIGAPQAIVDYLINRCRSFIYSTAPPPLQAHMVHQALWLLPMVLERRDRVMQWRDVLNQTLPTPDSPSQIVPLIFGENQKTIEVALAMQDAGFDVRAIRPPSVSPGTARLRVSLHAGLNLEDIHRFAETLSPYLTAYSHTPHTEVSYAS